MGGAALGGIRVDRGSVEAMADHFVSFGLAANDIPYYICGSYRRGRASVGDIELVFNCDPGYTRDQLENKIAKIFGRNLNGNAKMQGLFAQVQYDIFISDVAGLGAMLMHTTGSGLFNIKMRACARKRGWLLNQYGLFQSETRIAGHNEESIFMSLGLTYQTPAERDMR